MKTIHKISKKSNFYKWFDEWRDQLATFESAKVGMIIAEANCTRMGHVSHDWSLEELKNDLDHDLIERDLVKNPYFEERNDMTQGEWEIIRWIATLQTQGQTFQLEATPHLDGAVMTLKCELKTPGGRDVTASNVFWREGKLLETALDIASLY